MTRIFKPSIRWMIMLKGDEYMNYTEIFRFQNFMH